MMEPTILHCGGACLDAPHDAAVLFLDHQGARLRFLDGVDLSRVSAAQLDLEGLHGRFRISEPSLSGGYGRAHPDDTPLFAKLAHVAMRCGSVLVVGPGSAKHEFVKYLARNHPRAIEDHLAGVETVDHPTDGQLVALARAAFARRENVARLHFPASRTAPLREGKM